MSVIPIPHTGGNGGGGGPVDPTPGLTPITVPTAAGVPADPTSVPAGTTYLVADEDLYYVAGEGGWYNFQGGGGSFTYLYEWMDGLPLCSDPGQPVAVDSFPTTVNGNASNPPNVEAAHFVNPFQMNSMILHFWALGPRVRLVLEEGATLDKFLLRTPFGLSFQDSNGNPVQGIGGGGQQMIDFSAAQPSSFDNSYYVELPRESLTGKITIPRGDRFDVGVNGSVERSGANGTSEPVAAPEPKLKVCVIEPATIIARGILGP